MLTKKVMYTAKKNSKDGVTAWDMIVTVTSGANNTEKVRT